MLQKLGKSALMACFYSFIHSFINSLSFKPAFPRGIETLHDFQQLLMLYRLHTKPRPSHTGDVTTPC